MKKSLLSQLPPPPEGCTGWPWTEESDPLPPKRSDGLAWPKISIVTPSFNQGDFIEETIRSIILQNYSDLEYFIVDGGSTDGTVEVIKKYEKWISGWVSEPDRGQPHALNKGLQICTGQLFQFINSDDLLTKGALATVARLSRHAAAVAGCVEAFSNSMSLGVTKNEALNAVGLLQKDKSKTRYCQPGVWLNRKRLMEVGGFSERYQFAFDIEVMLRYLEVDQDIIYTDAVLARFRHHPTSKSVSLHSRFALDHKLIADEILRSSTNENIRSAAAEWAKSTAWKALLSKIESSRERSRIIRTLLICSLAVRRDQHVRLSRLTAGTIKRLWLGR